MNLIVLGSEEENLVTISFLEDIPIKRTGINLTDWLYIQCSQNDFAAETCFCTFASGDFIQSYINHHRIFYYYLIVMFSKRKCKIRLHHILLLIDLIILLVSNTI